MEPQIAYAIPQEAGTLKIIGAFQYQVNIGSDEHV
jgi:hypothetical protein